MSNFLVVFFFRGDCEGLLAQEAS